MSSITSPVATSNTNSSTLTSPSSSTPPATGYFIDHKKGEVNELKVLLKDINVERDVKRKREVIKKVIAYMTLGIDVSRLFTDMVMAIETKDIVIKKMVYLYLCSYAHKEPEMAVLCINTLRRDCDDDDPMVRGLALRSLCSLRLLSMLEYVQQPVRKGLSDISAYVRKTAVMGVLKLHSLDAGVVEANGYTVTLMELLMDVDINVVTNAVLVLNELNLAQGGLEVTPATVAHLLNRIAELSEWGLCAVLELVSRYEVQSENEMYAVMNLLDPVLRSANSGAVLGTVKCFLGLTARQPDLLPQILLRTKAPLMTLITGTQPEIQYTTLKHLLLICSGHSHAAARGAFDDEFRHFFVRYNEPSHVKYLKVEILPWVANDRNARDVVSELIEYVTDVDAELARRAIAAMGAIARRVASVAEETAQQLVDLLDLNMTYVRGEALKALASLLRVFPAVKAQVVPFLGKFWRRVCTYESADGDSSSSSSSFFAHYTDGAAGDTTEARAVVLWMIGEYGEDVPEAPYLLETAVQAYHEEHSSSALKLQLLTATMKLFFKRPPEVHPYLGTLLALAVEDTCSQDVHDRALLYYRLLSCADVQAAKRVFCSGDDSGAVEEEKALCGALYALGFAEQRDAERMRSVLKEFNSLAVIYGTPSALFTEDGYRLKLENAPLHDTFSMLPPSLLSVGATAVVTAVAAVPVGDGVNLLDWGDYDADDADALRPLGSGAAAVASGAASSSSSSSSSSLVLRGRVDMTPQRFQELWTSLPCAHDGPIGSLSAGGGSSALTIAMVEDALRARHVHVMASGPSTDPAGMKLFVYGQEVVDDDDDDDDDDLLLACADGRLLLAQLVVDMDARTATLTLKTSTDDVDAAVARSTTSAAVQGNAFAGLLLQALAPLGFAPT